MDWINRKATAYLADKKDYERKEEIINMSNYWVSLHTQIAADIQEINEHPVWSEILQGKSIKLTNTDGKWQIHTPHYPAVFISIVNHATEIALRTEIIESHEIEGDVTEEILKVEVSAQRVCLRNEKDVVLFVPEEASEYILKPILEVLGR